MSMKIKTHKFKDMMPVLDFEFGTRNLISERVGWMVWWGMYRGWIMDNVDSRLKEEYEDL